MEISNTVKYYNKIMESKTERELVELTVEIHCSVIKGEISNEIEMMLLNIAIQLQQSSFVIAELRMSTAMAALLAQPDFDPEKKQLEQFQAEELEDFKEGEVLTMKDFTKDKK